MNRSSLAQIDLRRRLGRPTGLAEMSGRCARRGGKPSLGQMVLRCSKCVAQLAFETCFYCLSCLSKRTGRLFFNTADATEHAEAFGKEYANFDEVGMDHKVWIAAETGRVCYSEADVQKMKVRDPESKTWEALLELGM